MHTRRSGLNQPHQASSTKHILIYKARKPPWKPTITSPWISPQHPIFLPSTFILFLNPTNIPPFPRPTNRAPDNHLPIRHLPRRTTSLRPRLPLSIPPPSPSPPWFARCSMDTHHLLPGSVCFTIPYPGTVIWGIGMTTRLRKHTLIRRTTALR